MFKNSKEYKEAVRKSFEKESACLRGHFGFAMWRKAFEAGFDAARNPEDEATLKAGAQEKFEGEFDVRPVPI